MSELVLLRAKDAKPDPLDPHNDLPSVEHVPILEDYWRLGFNRFREKHAVETKTDERGFTDYGWLLSYIDSLVSRDFLWPNNTDVHHLQWAASSYEPKRFGHTRDPNVPTNFREIAYHKLLIPRQMHNLIHKITIPPDVPQYDLMEKRLAAYNTALLLFQVAKRTLDIEMQGSRLVPLPNGDPRFIDPVSRRVITREILLDRYSEFTDKFRDKYEQITDNDLDGLIDTHIFPIDPSPTDILTILDKRVFLLQKKRAIRPKLRITND